MRSSRAFYFTREELRDGPLMRTLKREARKSLPLGRALRFIRREAQCGRVITASWEMDDNAGVPHA